MPDSRAGGGEPLLLVLLEGIDAAAGEAMAERGRVQVDTRDTALGGDELTAAIARADLVGIRSRTRLTAEVLARAPRLLAIGCFCSGTNQVDLRAAALQGIPVFNAPFANTRSVAELVIGEIILLLRGVGARNAEMHAGRWMKGVHGAREVRGKTLGIVGYGHIGTQVGILAEQLGMVVRFHDAEPRLALGNARAVASLDELLAEAHVVSLHVPAVPSTANMIDADALAKMRRGAMLINASRGSAVDLEALAGALEAGRLGGAAIDVFPDEPDAEAAAMSSPLARFDNVILTPHIGGSTIEAQAAIGAEVAAKLGRYLVNGTTVAAVNFPRVVLPEHTGKCRLLHVHRNIPGVMAQVNERFSRSGINIAAQYLQTNAEVGYVVIDVDAEASDIALDRLASVDGTIRCRILR